MATKHQMRTTRLGAHTSWKHAENKEICCVAEAAMNQISAFENSFAFEIFVIFECDHRVGMPLDLKEYSKIIDRGWHICSANSL